MATISVSLPADGSTGTVSQYNTPLTTITNEINGNLDNANIKSGAGIATSKLADDNGIGANKLSSSAICLGYAQITSNFTTTSTSATLVTGLSASVTIPAGSRKIKITAFSRAMYGSTVNSVQLSIWDGTVGSGTQIGGGTGQQNGTGAGNGLAMAVVTPSAGAKTYNVGFNVATGTGTLEAGATYPAFILVEAI